MKEVFIIVLIIVLFGGSVPTNAQRPTFTSTTLPGNFVFLDWNNPDHRIVFTLVGSTPYRSVDYGKTFASLDSNLPGFDTKYPQQNAIFPGGYGVRKVLINPYNTTHWIFMGQSKIIWITKDSGETFQTIQSNEQLFNDIIFHPFKPEWLLGFVIQDPKCFGVGPCSSQIYASKNYGLSWTNIDQDVAKAEWQVTQGTTYVIYQKADPSIGNASLYLTSETPLHLYQSDLQSSTLLLQDVETFASMDDFLYALIRIPFAPKFYKKLPADRSHSLELYVRTKDSFQSETPFLKTNLHTPLKNFKILETQDGVMLLDIPLKQYKPSLEFDTFITNLWKSDISGTRFSLSIPNIISENLDAQAEDFHVIDSLEATFIANHIPVEQQDESNNIMFGKITWNHGGEWKLLKTVDELQGIISDDDGHLMLLGKFFATNYPKLSSIHSEKHAPGAIIANGALGVTLKDYMAGSVKSDVYYSRNGGISFSKIRSGPHYCQFLNEGSFIFCVPGTKANQFFYSIDQGSTWITTEFASEPVEIISIDSEEGFGLAVVIITKLKSQTVIYSANLRELNLQKCQLEHYETWRPSDGREGTPCIMGREYKYQRPKANSNCWSDRVKGFADFFPCPCAEQDFECDVDFFKDSNGECVFETVTPLPISVCEKGTWFFPSGYRKIAGNMCNSTLPTSIRKDTPLVQRCDQEEIHVFSYQAIAIGLGVTIPLSLVGVFSVGYAFCKRKSHRKYKSVRTDDYDLDSVR